MKHNMFQFFFVFSTLTLISQSHSRDEVNRGHLKRPNGWYSGRLNGAKGREFRDQQGYISQCTAVGGQQCLRITQNIGNWFFIFGCCIILSISWKKLWYTTFYPTLLPIIIKIINKFEYFGCWLDIYIVYFVKWIMEIWRYYEKRKRHKVGRVCFCHCNIRITVRFP